MSLTINTNLSSLMVQMNLQKSTFSLNDAIEKMTTGYKINHAKDNAAGYSIAQNMSSQLSSYGVAQDNIAAGLDLVSTAQDTISLMQSHGQRIHALITQAQNGTYGASSLSAIQSEVNARVAEITRLYSVTEYNGIDLFNGVHLPDWAQGVKANAGAGVNNANGDFIADPVTHTQAEVDALTHVSDVPSFTSGGKYQVSTKEDLIHLAELVNSNEDTTNVTFVMGADIDLSSVENWTPIGDYSTNTNYQFKGTFDGNGHKITNLKINNPTKDYQGLFGRTDSGSEIKNVGVSGDVTGAGYTGGLVGSASGAITNSYATGTITGTGEYTGGLAGEADDIIKNSYATGNVTGGEFTGGLTGYADDIIKNSYATGNVTGANSTGGLAGEICGAITNSYATGNVTGTGSTGGLVGHAYNTVTNSYTTGNVTGGNKTGGLAGCTYSRITNSYATGTVTGTGEYTGGLAGYIDVAITNSYATGNVAGAAYIGGLAGEAYGTISNSYATGDVTGADWTGGLVGQLYQSSGTLDLDKILSAGTVTSTTGNQAGSLIGGIVNTDNGTSFSTINITNASALSQGLDMIGFEGTSDGAPYQSGQMESWLSNITELEKPSTTLQVGINGDNSSQITFKTSLSLNLKIDDITSSSAYDSINAFFDQLNTRATELGAVSNRLESALESTTVAIDNLTSSRSTIKDADIAKVSSDYIRSQILQQASATLLATANQSPSIALQLL